MGLFNHGIIVLMACALSFFTSPSFAKKRVYDPNCDCYVEDPTTPDIQEPDDPPPPPSPPDPSPFALKGTGVNSSTAKRDLSEVVPVSHPQPDGGDPEDREFRYSTPKNFANRAKKSVNLWFVFHGGGGSSKSMHKYFDEISHAAPTLFVYPQALRVNHDNVVDGNRENKRLWRAVRKPGSASDPNSFRDVVFIDWLTTKLLQHNSQLKKKRVFASGFSSGAGMTWMLLCYRAAPFQGFAMYSQQLGSVRVSDGCGDGQLPQAGDARTGYEKLTGQQPDKYGYSLSSVQIGGSIQRAATKAVFYVHGTADENLVHDGDIGCWERGECELSEDPQYSMDPEGPLEDRDDISTVHWLTRRHQLPSQATGRIIVPDVVKDGITTSGYDYKSVSDSAATFDSGHGEPIRWYEMKGAAHGLSALDRDEEDKSKDYDVSVHTQKFFEAEAMMLKKK